MLLAAFKAAPFYFLAFFLGLPGAGLQFKHQCLLYSKHGSLLVAEKEDFVTVHQTTAARGRPLFVRAAAPSPAARMETCSSRTDACSRVRCGHAWKCGGPFLKSGRLLQGESI
ncbi:hypothetical protein SRHO_G00115310 [Serrasalmus rhombeus]